MSTFVTNTSHKSRKVALILCILLGMVGAHNFYVGRYGRGILFLMTAGFFMFGWVIDIFKILLGDFKDRQGNKLVEW